MSENIYNFTINQGETFSKLITWRDSAGDLINLTGYTARMDLRRKPTDAASLLSLTTANSRITLGGAAGTITLLVSAADTALLSGTYVYDLELVNGSVVKRLLQGQIEIDLEVTK